jgi:alanyl-tRNA synthetase
MVTKTYLRSNQLNLTTTVTDIGNDDKGKWVRLEETLFHPQGGGQQADKGFINDSPVVHVSHTIDGEVNHYVDEKTPLAIGDSAFISINEEVRALNTKLHTAGHFIAAVIEENFPELHAVGGHHWPGESRVEFEGNAITQDVVPFLEKEISKGIKDDLPIDVEGNPFSSRKIKIWHYTSVPCGGTHLTSTAQLEGLKITKSKSNKGRLRISYEIES